MINDEQNGFISQCGTFIHLYASNISKSEDNNSKKMEDQSNEEKI